MWSVHEREASAAELHDADLIAHPRTVWRLRPSSPAIVLGSSQRDDVLDGDAVAARGLERCRRRSGGGVVLLSPDSCAWVDVVVPVGDERWDDDVTRAFHWLGDAWVNALARNGVHGEVHRAGPLCRGAGRVVCFAGVGGGEVLVDDRKVVGMSQRRDRRGARFQCVAYAAWDPDATLSLLGPGAGDAAGRAAIATRLRDHVGAVADLDRVVDAFVATVVSG